MLLLPQVFLVAIERVLLQYGIVLQHFGEPSSVKG
jgi:hypothetical protein